MNTRSPIFLVAFISAAVFLQGCIKAPVQTVELSEVVGEQTAQMRISHESFVRLYYAKLRQDVDEFMKTRWVPTFLSKAVENTQFRADLDGAYVTANIDPETLRISGGGLDEIPQETRDAIIRGIEQAIADQRARLGQVMVDFSEEAMRQIQNQRTAMITPLDEQEALVLGQLAEGYADLQRAQATIHGYLATAVKVQQEREAVLNRLHLLDVQREILNEALRAGDAATTALRTIEDGSQAVTDFMEAMQEGKRRLGALRGTEPSDPEEED